MQEINGARASEQLHFKCATLESQGLVSRRDLNEAYKSLAVPPAFASQYSDDRLIGLYQARTTDSSPAVIDSLRKALHTIGTSRGSSALINAAKESVETYEEAINWLGNGVTKDAPDDFVLTAYAIKVCIHTLRGYMITSVTASVSTMMALEQFPRFLRLWL